MGQTQNDDITAKSSPLEKLCQRCGGTGGHKRMYQPEWDDCPECDGAGYVPTDDGRRILDLIEHNFRQMFERMESDED